MKSFAMLLLSILVSSSFLANAEEYNLIQAPLKQHANWSKAAVILDAVVAQGQIIGSDLANSKREEDTKLCFRLGSVFTSIINSSVRYGIRSTDAEEVKSAKQTFILAMSAATYCGFDATQIVNPGYVEIVAGKGIYDQVEYVSSRKRLNVILMELIELIKVK